MQRLLGLALAISISYPFSALAKAEDVSQGADNRSYCSFLLTGQARIDADAAPLVKAVYNLMAKEFSDLESKAEASEQSIDVVQEFNARPALNGAVVSAARLSSVSISEINESLDPVSFGIEDRRVSKGALQLERSQRSNVLSRLLNLSQRVSQVRKKGGDSGVEFAKVYRGKQAIAEYVLHTAMQMRNPLKDSVKDPEGTIEIGESDNGSSFSFFIAGYKSTPVSETHSRVSFWLMGLNDANNGLQMTMPNWLVAPMTSLLGIWVFPGEIGTNIADQMTGLSERVNSWLTYGAGLIHPTEVRLWPQVVYSGAAVGGYFAYRLYDKLQKVFNPPVVIENNPAPAPIEPPRPKLQAVTAQHLAVVKMLIDIARGEQRLGAGNLIHWGTNYRYKDSTLAFDLLLFEQDGEPVLTVVNKEI